MPRPGATIGSASALVRAHWLAMAWPRESALASHVHSEVARTVVSARERLGTPCHQAKERARASPNVSCAAHRQMSGSKTGGTPDGKRSTHSKPIRRNPATWTARHVRTLAKP